jgi:hypothetical protein
MTRRLLSLIELTLFTEALAFALGLLAHAANVGHAQWADPAMAGVVTALSLLVPTTLAALLRAAWLGTPPMLRAVRGRVHDWRQWRGIQRVDAAPVRPVRDTMAVRPRAAHAAHAAQPARDGLTQAMPVAEAGLWRPRAVGGGR